MMKERRKSPRARCDFVTEFEYQHSNVAARVMNISSLGMYMECDRPVPLFREIGIGIKLPGIERLIEGSGVVVRTEKVPGKEHYNLAIFFDNIQPKDKSLLTGFVEKQLAS